MQKYDSRADVPEKYKWDLTSFFQNDEEFNTSYEKTQKKIKELKQYGGCTKNASKLLSFLTLQINTIADLEDLYAYAYLINDQELGNSESIKRKYKVELLDNELIQATSFFEPELLKLDKESYNKLFEEEPKLEEFKAELDRCYREKDYILTENEEKIVAELTNSMQNFEEMSSTMLNSEHDYGHVTIDGEKVTIAPNNYRKIMRNKDENIRKKAYRLFNKKLEQYAPSSASFLNGYVSYNNSISKIRHFKSSWDRKLFSLNLSDKVFKSLVNTTEENLSSLHKYYELKKKVLNLPILHTYDLSLDLAKSSKEYEIEEAEKLVKEAIKPLGEEYSSHFAKIFTNHYIDYCQYKGKCSGGYSLATIKQDSRILMSYNGELDSVSTIAHEGGHNVNHQYVNESNPMQYRFQDPIVAEVFSLTNECLLSSYLAEHGTTKEEKLAGLANIMNVIVSNLFGAVREGKIEEKMYKEVEKGNILTKDFLNKEVKKSLKKYYGPAVKTDQYIKNGWITRSHYYSFFYLYSYSICISVACSVANSILNGDKEVLKKYLDFLKVGGDKWPSEAFQTLGVNLEDKKVYENAIRYFDSLVEKYNEIYDSKEV